VWDFPFASLNFVQVVYLHLNKVQSFFWQTFVFDKKGVGVDSLLGKTTVAKQLEAYLGLVRVDPEMVVELAIAYAIDGKKSFLQILH
jgi:hypothetical protein